MKWFYKVGINKLKGYDTCGILDSKEEDVNFVGDLAWELAVSNAESHFSVIELNEQDIFEHDGEEYLRTFIFYDDIYYITEPYMPEIHDELL